MPFIRYEIEASFATAIAVGPSSPEEPMISRTHHTYADYFRGTICSNHPSVCDGSFSNNTLDLSNPSTFQSSFNMLSGALPTEVGLLTQLACYK